MKFWYRSVGSLSGALAYKPPITDPMLVPVIQSISSPECLMACNAPRWASPSGPPTESTTHVLRLLEIRNSPPWAHPEMTIVVARQNETIRSIRMMFLLHELRCFEILVRDERADVIHGRFGILHWTTI